MITILGYLALMAFGAPTMDSTVMSYDLFCFVDSLSSSGLHKATIMDKSFL